LNASLIRFIADGDAAYAIELQDALDVKNSEIAVK
jgi:hypothetical protein